MRISMLVSKTQSEHETIQHEFFGSANDAFYRLRNKIAHGDPNLDLAVIEAKYWSLYHYITAAIRNMLSLPTPGENVADYHEAITQLIRDRFANLSHS